MKKIFILLISLIFILVFFPVVSSLVSANPSRCPDGHTCWCGQQKNTGKMMWFVDEAQANGWNKISDSACFPPDISTATNTLQVTGITMTSTIEPIRVTLTAIPTQSLFLAVTPTGVILTQVSARTLQSTVLSLDTPIPVCDECSIKQKEVDIKQQEVNVQKTLASNDATRVWIELQKMTVVPTK